MDLTTTGTIIGIIGGIIGIIKAVDEFIRRGSEPLPQFIKLLFAIGIIAFLYGGILTISAAMKASSVKQDCLLGKDVNSYSVQVFCNNYTDATLAKDIKPGLLFVGLGLVLVAVTLLLQKFSSSSITGFVFQISLVLVGIWLINSSF